MQHQQVSSSELLNRLNTNALSLSLFISDGIGEKRGPGLSAFELKTIQRILLELLCQYELSTHFRSLPLESASKNYYEIIDK